MEMKTTAHIPVIDTKDMITFPNAQVVLYLNDGKDTLGLENAMNGGNQVLLVAQRPESKEPSVSFSQAYGNNANGLSKYLPVAVLAEVSKVRKSNGGTTQVILSTKARKKLLDLSEVDGFLQGTYDDFPTEIDLDEKTSEVLLENIRSSAKDFVKLIPQVNFAQLSVVLNRFDDLESILYFADSHLPLEFEQKRELLEMQSLKRLALLTLDYLVQKRDSLKLQQEIGQKVSDKINKQQREAILRSQLQAIKSELNDLGADGSEEEESYEVKINDSLMPDDVKKKALTEASKLSEMGERSPETGVIKNYLDTLLALPWGSPEKTQINIDEARKVLDAEHYGLEDVKKRIIQHLGVMHLKKDKQGSVILLVGPPGVGKTSMGKSIANALGRKFVRASLGGVRDEAEIRGHRRTYVGAMPGKIIDSLKNLDEKNPVFLLDEIDKLSRGFSGDPSAALLEVLDPKQNDTFKDHFLDVPYDLSDVLFIATANSLDTIPRPLLDRMEIIKVSSYTEAEKLHIAERYLFPRQRDEHGIKANQLQVSRDAVQEIIHSYTREAGVRELERQLAQVCRSSVENIISEPEKLHMINTSDLKEHLGPLKFKSEVISQVSASGVTTGLAWTPVGGDILFIEAKRMPGHGKLLLTGQLGDVMRESAQIALTQVRSQLMRPDKPIIDFDKLDIHVHVPQGSIPKDGPSAGITMLTTLASLMLDTPVDPSLAMTGELTLRGAVTAIGGVKEKLLAAHRAGVKKVLIPKDNERDLEEVPEEVLEQLEVIPVSHVSEVLWHALAMEKLESISQLPGAVGDAHTVDLTGQNI